MSTTLIARSKAWTCSLCACDNGVFLPHERHEEPVASSSRQAPVQERNDAAQLVKEEPLIQNKGLAVTETTEPVQMAQDTSSTPHVSSSDQVDLMMLDPNPAATDPVSRETSATLRTFSASARAAPTPSTGHIHFSVAGAFRTKIQLYERVLMVIDTLSGAICALLVLWVLKHL